MIDMAVLLEPVLARLRIYTHPADRIYDSRRTGVVISTMTVMPMLAGVVLVSAAASGLFSSFGCSGCRFGRATAPGTLSCFVRFGFSGFRHLNLRWRLQPIPSMGIYWHAKRHQEFLPKAT